MKIEDLKTLENLIAGAAVEAGELALQCRDETPMNQQPPKFEHCLTTAGLVLDALVEQIGNEHDAWLRRLQDDESLLADEGTT